MSDPSLPPSSDPSEYASEPTPASYYVPPTKPTSVMVIGIIGIVLGALGLICTPIALVPYMMPSMGASQPAIALVQASKPLMAWTVFMLVISLLLAILLLASSIGSITLKRWARPSMIAYAIGAIVLTVLNTAVQCLFVLPALFARAKTGTPQDYGAAIGGAIGAVVGLVIALVLPTFILVFFRKPHVIEAFERAQPYGG